MGNPCVIFVSVLMSTLVIICAILFFLFMSDKHCITPRVYIEEVYAPAQSDDDHGTNTSSSIIIDLQFKKPGVSVSVPSFRNLSMNVYYGFPVANYTVPPFQMISASRRIFEYRAAVEAPRLPWKDVLQTLKSGGNDSKVALVVELLAQYLDADCDDRLGWVNLNLQANVWLGASGHKLSNKPIRLV